jgi:hypothetical protein
MYDVEKTDDEMLIDSQNELSAIISTRIDMSNETVDVVRRTLELSETIIEAIDYLIERLEEDNFERGTAMLSVVGDGLESLEKTIPVIFNEKNLDADVCEKCVELFTQASEAFEDTANAVIGGDLDEMMDMSDHLKEAYSNWDAAVNTHLKRISIM